MAFPHNALTAPCSFELSFGARRVVAHWLDSLAIAAVVVAGVGALFPSVALSTVERLSRLDVLGIYFVAFLGPFAFGVIFPHLALPSVRGLMWFFTGRHVGTLPKAIIGALAYWGILHAYGAPWEHSPQSADIVLVPVAVLLTLGVTGWVMAGLTGKPGMSDSLLKAGSGQANDDDPDELHSWLAHDAPVSGKEDNRFPEHQRVA